MSFNSWDFAKLATALDVRAMSVRIGAGAGMVIVACSTGRPLPEHIQRWLDSVILQQEEARPLFIALECDDPASKEQGGLPGEFLRRWAARWHADLVCCADLHHPSSRQPVLRHINGLLHSPLPAVPCEPCEEPAIEGPAAVHQTMKKRQASMTQAQIEQVRTLAYHLWLQAKRPDGMEMEFWLRAERQFMQAAAGNDAA